MIHLISYKPILKCLKPPTLKCSVGRLTSCMRKLPKIQNYNYFFSYFANNISGRNLNFIVIYYCFVVRHLQQPLMPSNKIQFRSYYSKSKNSIKKSLFIKLYDRVKSWRQKFKYLVVSASIVKAIIFRQNFLTFSLRLLIIINFDMNKHEKLDYYPFYFEIAPYQRIAKKRRH